MPHLSYSPDLTASGFFLLFVSQDKKSPQKEMFCQCAEVKQKMAEALKGIKIDKFKNCFEQWKKTSQ